MLRHFVLPSAALLGALVLGCGAKVVFEEGSANGDGAAGAGAGGSGAAGADGSGAAGAAGGFGLSTSTGPADPCLGATCGDTCTVCNDQECLTGQCDATGSCSQITPDCTVQTLCYAPAPMEDCAAVGAAPFHICPKCKGCVFIGTVLDGPFVTPEGCCYSVVGSCSAAPD